MKKKQSSRFQTGFKFPLKVSGVPGCLVYPSPCQCCNVICSVRGFYLRFQVFSKSKLHIRYTRYDPACRMFQIFLYFFLGTQNQPTPICPSLPDSSKFWAGSFLYLRFWDFYLSQDTLFAHPVNETTIGLSLYRGYMPRPDLLPIAHIGPAVLW